MPQEEGVFWLPRAKASAVRGILSFGPGTRPQLTVLGSIKSAVRVVEHSTGPNDEDTMFSFEPDPDSEDFTIHGYIRSSPRRVTLVGCNITHESEVAGLSVSLDRQIVTPLHVVQGAHTSGREQVYDAIQVRVANIDEWASLPGFSVSEGSRDAAVLRYDRPSPERAETSSGATVEIIEILTRSPPRPTGGHIYRESWVRVDKIQAGTLNELSSRYVTPVASGLGIMIGTASPITQLQVRVDAKWCDIWFSNMPEYPEDRLHLRKILLPLGICGIDVVANMIDLGELTGPVSPVIADADSLLQRSTLETQVLELTTLAEGLHRSVFDEESRFEPDDASRIRELVRTALASEEPRSRQIVEGFLSHMEEPSYRTRIRQLAELAEELLPGVSGRTNRWVTLTDGARNAFAHRKEGYLTPTQVDEYYAVSRSLLWILRSVVLIQADAVTVECAKWVRGDGRYRQYLRNMRGAVPKVFDLDEENK